MKNRSSGGLGLLGLLGIVALFVILRRLFPSFAGLLLTVGGIALLCIIALVGLVLFASLRKPKPKADQEKAEYAAALLAQGRSDLLALRQLALRVKNQKIRASSQDVCQVIEQILSALKEQPEDIPKARQLFSYYLPTLGGILQRFVRLEQSGVPAADSTEKVISGLSTIRIAMEKLYASLFEDERLDLTVEMEVLKQLCQQDGLLSESAVQAQDEDQDQNITLSL